MRRLSRIASASLAAAAAALLMPLVARPQQDFDSARAALVEEIAATVRGTSAYTGRTTLDRRVMRAIGRVPRHEFVPTRLRTMAYLNQPLPIGEDQTISQPFIVALMTDLADVGRRSVVLEVGTGSGYQAAVLAEIVEHVYTIEIIEPLGRRAAETLERLGYDNVTARIGDGYAGWPEHAPFDAILVTAAPEQVPAPLVEQLAVGGRLVIPVGPQGRVQSLNVLVKNEDGTVETSEVMPVSFVPLTRDDADD